MRLWRDRAKAAYKTNPSTVARITRFASGRELLDNSHRTSTTAIVEIASPAGRLNNAFATLRLRRRTGRAAHVTAYVINRIIVLSVAADANVPEMLRASMPQQDSKIAT